MARRTPRRTRDRAPSRRGPGRVPLIADPDRVAALLDAVSAGVPITQACHYAGLHPATHHRAIAAAEEADARADAGHKLDERARVYREYRDRFMRARAEVAAVHVRLVADAARGGQLVRRVTRSTRGGTETEEQFAPPEWRAAAWLLSKSFPGELGDRSSVEVSGPGGGPVEHAGPGEAALSVIADRLAEVAERQRAQLPGGWESERPALAGGRVIDGEVGGDVGDGPR